MLMNQDVGGFQVPMHHVILLQALHPFKDLFEDPQSLILSESALVPFQYLIEISSVAVLHNQV
jgi:hypothetical protein